MSEENAIASNKVPMFDGNAENFQIWWARFKAFAKTKKFKKALEIAVRLGKPGAAMNALKVPLFAYFHNLTIYSGNE